MDIDQSTAIVVHQPQSNPLLRLHGMYDGVTPPLDGGGVDGSPEEAAQHDQLWRPGRAMVNVNVGLHFHGVQDEEWQARGVSPALVALLCEWDVDVGEAEVDHPCTLDECLVMGEGAFGRRTGAIASAAVRLVSLMRKAGVPLPSRSGGADDSAARGGQCLLAGGRDDGAGCLPLEGRSAKDLEREERVRQMNLLLAVLPDWAPSRAIGARDAEWAAFTLDRRKELLTCHFCSFSAGSLSSCRRALSRLSRWLAANMLVAACRGFNCSGAVLSSWVLDEKAASRTSGESVPLSLRTGVDFARRHAGLWELQTSADAFSNIAAKPPNPPKPARAVTVGIFYHFLFLAMTGKEVVAEIASICVLCCIAALRVRDAQRRRHREQQYQQGRKQQ